MLFWLPALREKVSIADELLVLRDGFVGLTGLLLDLRQRIASKFAVELARKRRGLPMWRTDEKPGVAFLTSEKEPQSVFPS